MNLKIGFLGGGNMASSIIQGLIKTGHTPNNITSLDRHENKLQRLHDAFGVNVTQDLNHLVKHSQILILAIKPQSFYETICDFPILNQKEPPLIISVAAGITLKQISSWLKQPCSLVRAMPNTPAAIGESATALYAGKEVHHSHRSIAETIFKCIGTTIWVNDEKLLNVITALSGSGPAFYFYFFESLIDAAQQLGLPEDIAESLCLQTAIGSAKLAKSEGNISALRAKVVSKGGTTDAGLKHLTAAPFREIILATLKAATYRAQQLSEELANKDI